MPVDRTRIYAGLLLVVLVAVAQSANAVVTFYTERAAWELAVASPTRLDFEGIVADGEWGTPERGPFVFNGDTIAVDGLPFSVSLGTIGISGSRGPVAGAPYGSALLFSNNGAPITADVSSLGSIVAVGAFFGNILQRGSTTLTLVGSSGVLDEQNVLAGGMGLGSAETFYGWTVTGDSIVSVIHSAGSFAGIDDFAYSDNLNRGGSLASDTLRAQIPEPGTLGLLAAGLIGFGLRRRKRAA